MTEAPLLDTHAWIWWVHGDPRLGRQALKKLDALPAESRPAISDISLWEVATLVSLGRIDLGTTLSAWLDAAAHPRTVRILPITGVIAADLARLPDSFQRDPADRIIASTSRVHGLPVLTKDSAMIKSGLVRLWAAGSTSAPSPAELLPRLFELREALTDPTSPNAYFQGVEKHLTSGHVMETYLALEKRLAALGEDSWEDLKSRATAKLLSRQLATGRGWQELFDVLNEARAFSYLLRIGCTGVRFIPRATQKTPDLEAHLDGLRVLCEVKTINISDDEAKTTRRVNEGDVVLRKTATQLAAPFFEKLKSTLRSAVQQLDVVDAGRTAERIVFVVINFDEWVGDYHVEYFHQIDEFLTDLPDIGAELVFCPATNYFERNYTMRAATVFLG